MGPEESRLLEEVLASGMLVQGARVAAFERAVTRALDLVDAPDADHQTHAIAVTNGTVALELALATTPVGSRAGVGAGDEVIVPAVTWPSPGHAAILRGATPVLVDIRPDTWCIDPTAAAEALTTRTRAIVAIDQFGVPADVPTLRLLAPSIDLVEDSACALGSTLHGLPCGLLGDIGIYSFHPRKIITTGEGGMIVTRDPERAATLRALRNHGQSTPGTFVSAGPNARLSELHAAIGEVQMTRLDEILARRHALAERLREALALTWQVPPVGALVNHQTLGLVLPEPSRGTRLEARDLLLARLREDGIEASILSYALHRLPQFNAFGVNHTRRFPVAEAVVDGGLALPLHPHMTREDCDAIITSVRNHAGWAFGREALR